MFFFSLHIFVFFYRRIHWAQICNSHSQISIFQPSLKSNLNFRFKYLIAYNSMWWFYHYVQLSMSETELIIFLSQIASVSLLNWPSWVLIFWHVGAPLTSFSFISQSIIDYQFFPWKRLYLRFQYLSSCPHHLMGASGSWNHGEGLLTCGLLGPTPQGFWFIGLG